MSSTLYEIYRGKVFDLAKTLLVKHEEAAAAVNAGLRLRGYFVDESDPTTWKYYLNTAGEYHQADMDDLAAINAAGDVLGSPYMVIKKASDTGPVDADFTLSLIDPVTGDVAIANEYRYGTAFYRDLVRRYPEYEELILGILNPIPTSVSIPAASGDILYCGGYFRRIVTDGLGTRVVFERRLAEGLIDEPLIEDNEVSIISELETWIKGFLRRWNAVRYELVDDLYFSTLMGILYMQIPMVVLNMRLARCKTPEAHSYHVKEYLESRGRLGRYVDDLPLEQSLFLYRNIDYILNNVGRSDTFDLLVDKLATPAKIPLAGYALRHNLSDMPDNLLPVPKAHREIINFRPAGVGGDVISLETMLDREKDLARDNNRDLPETADHMTDHAKVSWYDSVPTKVVESTMLDLTDRLPYTLGSVIANYWIFCVAHGNFEGTVYVTQPMTGDRLQFTPRNALILALYCLTKATTPMASDVIPVINARMIPRSPTAIAGLSLPLKPSIVDLQAMVNDEFLEARDIITAFYGPAAKPVVPHVVTDPITAMVNVAYNGTVPDADYDYQSSDAFFRGAKRVHQQIMNRYQILCQEDDRDARLQFEEAFASLYWLEVPCQLTPITTYTEWLSLNGLTLSDIDELPNGGREIYLAFAEDLVKQATANTDNASEYLKLLQQAVMEIMRQLSSYMVQYIYTIDNSPAVVGNFKTLRFSNINSTSSSEMVADIGGVTVTDINGSSNESVGQIDLTPNYYFTESSGI